MQKSMIEQLLELYFLFKEGLSVPHQTPIVLTDSVSG